MGSRVQRSWELSYFRHHAAPLGFPSGPLSHQTHSGRMLAVGNHSPGILPSGYPPGWLNQSELINIFVLPYIIIILSAHSKSMTIKKCEIKYEKNTIPCETSAAVDPAKRDFERTRIELTMLDFRPGSERALPAHGGRPIAFPFWECGLRHHSPGSPFALRLRATRVSRGLALT
jgi:hypothetical protein